MIIIEFISLVVVCAVLGNPLLTLLGYLPESEEPKRHLWIGRLAPVPFVLLALDNAIESIWTQAGASLVVAVVLFLLRNYFSEEKRIRGEYARWFIFLSAAYWVSGLSESAYVAAALFVIIGFFLPNFFKLVAVSSDGVEDMPMTEDKDYSLESAPVPASVSPPPIRRFSRDGMEEEPRDFETVPAPARGEVKTDSVATPGSLSTFQPAPAVSPNPKAAIANVPQPAPVAAAVSPPEPRKRVIRPVDIITSVADPLSEAEASQLGIREERKSELLAPEDTHSLGRETQPSAENISASVSVAAVAATEPRPSESEEPTPTESTATAEAPKKAERMRPDDDPRPAPPENDLSHFKLPTLPPRTAMPKPFEGTVDPDTLKTEQPKPRTSGVSFRMDKD